MNCIVAVDANWGIGKNNDLLISIPEDMKYFRKTTAGKTLIYGRKTLESFPGQKPLPKRRNIVITHKADYSGNGAEIVHSVEEAVLAVKDEDPDDVFVIGGGNVYREMLPYCAKAYVTRIGKVFDADTFFPDLDREAGWEIDSQSDTFEHEGIPYRFVVYRKSVK